MKCKLDYYMIDEVREFVFHGRKDVILKRPLTAFIKFIPRRINIPFQESSTSNAEGVKNSRRDFPLPVTPEALRGLKLRIPIIKINKKKYLDFTEIR